MANHNPHFKLQQAVGKELPTSYETAKHWCMKMHNIPSKLPGGLTWSTGNGFSSTILQPEAVSPKKVINSLQQSSTSTVLPQLQQSTSGDITAHLAALH